MLEQAAKMLREISYYTQTEADFQKGSNKYRMLSKAKGYCPWWRFNSVRTKNTRT